MSALLACGLVAAAVTAALSLAVAEMARRIGWMDAPGERKTHLSAVPYGGGIALVAGIGAGTISAAMMNPALLHPSARILPFAAGLVATLFVGSWDDAKGLSPWAKLAFQIGLGLAMWFGGYQVRKVTGLAGDTIQINALGALLTVVWYVAIMNAMNLIDGLDGLAAGVAAIAGATILIISFSWSEPATALLSAIFVGSCLGFLPRNFHPAKIFLGDGGALCLGFCLATLALDTSTKSSALLALMIPIVALLIPVADATYAFARRLKSGRHPFLGDQEHLHHRLIRLGLTHRRVVLIFYYFSAVNGVLAWLLASLKPPDISTSRAVFVVFVMQAAGFLLLLEILSSLENHKRPHSRGKDGHP